MSKQASQVSTEYLTDLSLWFLHVNFTKLFK